ncbi:hypothetical protein KCP77_22965 [Salmonella enterica subsp. enterica]|nr:hypothetical protein KCP77_22965 [Salmonella enterica subsp. enterica]
MLVEDVVDNNRHRRGKRAIKMTMVGLETSHIPPESSGRRRQDALEIAHHLLRYVLGVTSSGISGDSKIVFFSNRLATLAILLAVA